jgi:hypothetical protein
LTDELFKRGWLIRAEVDNAIIEDAGTRYGNLGEPIISLSQIGKQSRAASLTKRFGRPLGEKIVADLIARQSEIDGLGLDALVAMRQAEAIVKALGHAGYEIRRRG